MSEYNTDNKDAIDIAPRQSHIHQEVAGMNGKTSVTREPYGKPGKFTTIDEASGRPRILADIVHRIRWPLLQSLRSNMCPLRHPRRSPLRL